MIRSIALATPWIVVAALTLVRGEPATPRAFAALCVVLAFSFVMMARSEKSAAKLAHARAILDASDQINARLTACTTPIERIALLDAQKSILQLAAREP